SVTYVSGTICYLYLRSVIELNFTFTIFLRTERKPASLETLGQFHPAYFGQRCSLSPGELRSPCAPGTPLGARRRACFLECFPRVAGRQKRSAPAVFVCARIGH